MSYTKTNWENLPSTNTPLNATNLNKIENELQQLDINRQVYSTTEQRIGTWIDNKPIYKKTFVISNTALSNGSNDISISIPNFKACIKTELNKGDDRVFPYMNTSGSTVALTFISIVSSTTLTIRCHNDTWGAGNTWYATIYYTKTTD